MVLSLPSLNPFVDQTNPLTQLQPFIAHPLYTGTSPGYYLRRSSTGNTNWVLFFQGGGWCYTPELCAWRSKTRLGSNKFWKPTIEVEGIMGEDPTANPDFHDWNVAYFQYCDGASFSGNANDPMVVEGNKLWYRGHRVKDALIADLMHNYGLGNATNVVVSGCSAGGLSTYLHADAVAGVFDTSKVRVKAMAGSGYFMDAPNLYGKRVYTDEMAYVFQFQNASGGVNANCIKATAPADQWQCMMAQYTYPHITTPFFIMNSGYDEWQMGNILGIDVPGFNSCYHLGYVNCSAVDIVAANKFRDHMIATMQVRNPMSVCVCGWVWVSEQLC